MRPSARVIFILILAILGTSLAAQEHYPFQNPKLPREDRVTNVLASMTLEEKINRCPWNQHGRPAARD